MDPSCCCDDPSCGEAFDTDYKCLAKKQHHRLPVSCRICEYTICYRCFKSDIKDKWELEVEDNKRDPIDFSVECPSCDAATGFDSERPNFNRRLCSMIDYQSKKSVKQEEAQEESSAEKEGPEVVVIKDDEQEETILVEEEEPELEKQMQCAGEQEEEQRGQATDVRLAPPQTDPSSRESPRFNPKGPPHFDCAADECYTRPHEEEEVEVDDEESSDDAGSKNEGFGDNSQDESRSGASLTHDMDEVLQASDNRIEQGVAASPEPLGAKKKRPHDEEDEDSSDDEASKNESFDVCGIEQRVAASPEPIGTKKKKRNDDDDSGVQKKARQADARAPATATGVPATAAAKEQPLSLVDNKVVEEAMNRYTERGSRNAEGEDFKELTPLKEHQTYRLDYSPTSAKKQLQQQRTNLVEKRKEKQAAKNHKTYHPTNDKEDDEEEEEKKSPTVPLAVAPKKTDKSEAQLKAYDSKRQYIVNLDRPKHSDVVLAFGCPWCLIFKKWSDGAEHKDDPTLVRWKEKHNKVLDPNVRYYKGQSPSFNSAGFTNMKDHIREEHLFHGFIDMFCRHLDKNVATVGASKALVLELKGFTSYEQFKIAKGPTKGDVWKQWQKYERDQMPNLYKNKFQYSEEAKKILAAASSKKRKAKDGDNNNLELDDEDRDCVEAMVTVLQDLKKDAANLKRRCSRLGINPETIRPDILQHLDADATPQTI